MEKKQTAVEWLIEQLEQESLNDYSFAQAHRIITLDISTFQTMFDQAKQLEKQQIVDAFHINSLESNFKILD